MATKRNEALAETALASPAKVNLFMFVTSDKGGIGKSLLFKVLGQILRKLFPIVVLFDGDDGTGSSVRAFGARDGKGNLLEEQDPKTSIGYYNLRKEKGRLAFVNSASIKAPLILHDLPGGGFDALNEIADAGEESLEFMINAIKGEGKLPVIFHLVHHDDEATESVARYLDATEGMGVLHVAVINRRDTNENDDFEAWYSYVDENGERQGGNTRKRLLEGGGFEIDLPKLPVGAANRIKRYNLTFDAATTDARLTAAQRSQVARWWRDVQRNFLDSPGFKKLFNL